MVAIPYSVGGISADWLRASVGLQDAGAFANLTSITAERLGEGAAMATDIHRLILGYAPGAMPGPPTLVAKQPSSNPEVRELARGWSMYRREVLFYREIAATVGLRIPKAYVAEFDPQTNWFVLVMEDLSHATDGDQVAGLSLEQTRLALDEIAGLHASWWNRPELVALRAVIQPFGEGLWIGTGARHAAAWPAFEKFVATRASPELRRVGERMAAAVEPMMIDMAREPRTLCHGDFRADNLMFSPVDGATALTTVDWQAPLQARGAFDVGHLMAMSVTTEFRRTHETDLLRGYHDKLVAGGVDAYAYDEFFHDYRRGLLIGFTYVVQAGPAVDMGHPRTEALFDSAVRRLDAAVQDHGLTEFVD
jgi:thiamine kinase-like enzyme